MPSLRGGTMQKGVFHARCIVSRLVSHNLPIRRVIYISISDASPLSGITVSAGFMTGWLSAAKSGPLSTAK